MQQTAQTPLSAYLIFGVIILVMIYFRGRSMSRPRPLQLAGLWIMPAIFLLITAATVIEFPPQMRDLPWLVVAGALGAALGWQRGRLMKIWVAPEDGRLMMRGSPWALIFLVAIILLRSVARQGLAMEAQSWALSPALINDGFVIFALGLFGVMRAEMGLRALRLSKAHAAGLEGQRPTA